MKQKRDLLSYLTTDPELPGELLPGQSLVELAGDSRVLIENHHGVVDYSPCRIGAAVRFGRVLVCGHCLELVHMTREQLVITGKVESITLIRKEKS